MTDSDSGSGPPERVRYRIRFSKRGPLRYTSHLDLARIWERALRRAKAPLLYSQGFNPRPQMQLAAALALGFEGDAELLDIWLQGDGPSPEELAEQLDGALPEGIRVSRIWPVDDRGPALQTLTRAAEYVAIPGEDVDAETLAARIDALLAEPHIERERRGKQYDLRPLILDAAVGDGDPPRLIFRLVLSQEEGTGRPDELLDALGLDPLAAQVTRREIVFSDDA